MCFIKRNQIVVLNLLNFPYNGTLIVAEHVSPA